MERRQRRVTSDPQKRESLPEVCVVSCGAERRVGNWWSRGLANASEREECFMSLISSCQNQPSPELFTCWEGSPMKRPSQWPFYSAAVVYHVFKTDSPPGFQQDNTNVKFLSSVKSQKWWPFCHFHHFKICIPENWPRIYFCIVQGIGLKVRG